MLKQICVILVGFIFVTLLLSFFGFYSVIRPFRILNYSTPKDYHLPYEEVTFYTKDGIKLQGWFIPSPHKNAKTIILLHGYPADKGDILASRLFLHPQYNLFFFDFRYFGKSGGGYTTLGKNEIEDLLAAINYLHTRGIDKVGVWGLSFGGSVALLTAPKTPVIKAVVAEASFARLDWLLYEYYPIPILRYPLGEMTRLWGILLLNYDIKNNSPLIAAEKLNIPVLLIHSEQDNVVSFNHALALQKAMQNNPHLEVVFTKGILHGQAVHDYQRIVRQFFDKYLGHT